MRASALPLAAVERFREDLAAAAGRPFAPDDLLALAVSGGADSMAMLALGHSAFPGRVIVATVDHGLRAAAADEAAMVASWCAAAGVPHATLAADRAIGPSDIQAGARAMRYDLLEAWATGAGATVLATAHHADDQAETFLMRAARGSGPAGLAGIRAHRTLGGIGLVRPLLGWRRAALRALVEASGIPFVDDPSNVDERFERVRVRQLLAAEPWLDPLQLAGAAAHAAEADGALADLAERLWHDHATIEGSAVRVVLPDVPRELRRRVARRAIDQVRNAAAIDRPVFDMASNIESLLDALERGKSATQGGVLVAVKRGIWHFKPAPPRRSH
ncbi:MAG TPA: tRNA lysidine(34) synthetase TilS [Sphingomonas sp.]|nr:tRNA lysidine(34) synthetase TilS [Sphingomonas sp.]